MQLGFRANLNLENLKPFRTREPCAVNRIAVRISTVPGESDADVVLEIFGEQIPSRST
jgi:hypothetical protein